MSLLVLILLGVYVLVALLPGLPAGAPNAKVAVSPCAPANPANPTGSFRVVHSNRTSPSTPLPILPSQTMTRAGLWRCNII